MSSTVELMQLICLLAEKTYRPAPESLFGNEEKMAPVITALRQHFVSTGLSLPPPESLQRRVVGGHVQQFIASSFRAVNDLNTALAHSVGRTIGDFEHVLDFGVGCGRIIRRVAEMYPHVKRTGADIDLEAITWLTGNYSEFGDFVRLPHRPPSTLPSESFDLVYSISVFTHLPEDLQFAWLAELQHITSKGAILLISVHGENYLRMFPPEAQSKAKADGGFLYNDAADLTDGLPEFYKNTYHTREYIECRWGEYFAILDYLPLAEEGRQDIVVCQRR